MKHLLSEASATVIGFLVVVFIITCVLFLTCGCDDEKPVYQYGGAGSTSFVCSTSVAITKPLNLSSFNCVKCEWDESKWSIDNCVMTDTDGYSHWFIMGYHDVSMQKSVNNQAIVKSIMPYRPVNPRHILIEHVDVSYWGYDVIISIQGEDGVKHILNEVR